MSLQAINVRNQFRGEVTAIIEGPVVSEVVALVKASEVSIAKI